MMKSFYNILAFSELTAKIVNTYTLQYHYSLIKRNRNNGSPIYTKQYADNRQKAKRNRPYYGHRNHKYIINHKNRK